MSKGWYVKVDIPVHFNIDCNVVVVGSCEREAEQKAREIVTKNLMEDFPWCFKVGGFQFTRGCETFGWDERDISCIVEPDSDFDPDSEEMTIEEVFSALAKADLDAELIEIFDENNAIWVKIDNVDTTREGEQEEINEN